jgi:hypothetical protein
LVIEINLGLAQLALKMHAFSAYLNGISQQAFRNIHSLQFYFSQSVVKHSASPSRLSSVQRSNPTWVGLFPIFICSSYFSKSFFPPNDSQVVKNASGAIFTKLFITNS